MTSHTDTLDKPKTAKALWFVAGWICFAVGAVGVVLPGIPTTGPMILALACFARSSKRFHDWLYHHRMFGPPLQRWRAHGLIPLKAKVMAVSMMTLSFVYVAGFSPLPLWAVVATGALIAFGAAFVLTRPHHVE